MENHHLISVIMIFLNGEEFIQEAIESVFSQSYKNWELVLVDDGSTDKSTEIALSYTRQYPDKVCYLEHAEHQNLGMSATRNLGIQNAKGEYLIFLDSDDVWMPQCLETLINIFNLHPQVNAVYGNTLYWYKWSNNFENQQEDNCDGVAELTYRPNQIFFPSQLLTLFLNDGNTVPCICSLMVKRTLMDTIGGFEKSFRGLYEDQIFYAKLGLNATIFVTSECLSKYRQHQDSCCAISLRLEQQKEKRLLFLNWLEKYLINQKHTKTDAWKLLQSELFSYQYPQIYKLRKYIQKFLYSVKSYLKSRLSPKVI